MVFPGFAQRDQLAAYYALAEALVFPTLSDPWGLVVNEAMACGLPIIASDAAGCVADLVQDGENGYVIPSAGCGQTGGGDDGAFARDPHLASRMGQHSARLIEAFRRNAVRLDWRQRRARRFEFPNMIENSNSKSLKILPLVAAGSIYFCCFVGEASSSVWRVQRGGAPGSWWLWVLLLPGTKLISGR